MSRHMYDEVPRHIGLAFSYLVFEKSSSGRAGALYGQEGDAIVVRRATIARQPELWT